MADATRQRRASRERRLSARGEGGLSLLATVVAGAALGTVLWRIAGPPRLPGGAPDWAHVREVLAGPTLTEGDIIVLATTIGWLALGYLAVAIGLRFLLVLAERVSGGASWARTALRLSNLVTLPVVRRAVDGGVAGTLVAASWLPAPTRVVLAADAAVVVARPLPVPAPAAAATGPAADHRAPEQQGPVFVEYTVADGDHLWAIARRCYGDGSRFIEVFEANRDRAMSDGERFRDPRLIRPGWVLRIPLPAQALEVSGDVVSYRVREGDHLWGIAERFLGDGFRWVEIWRRNQGRELGAGRRLTDASLIFPGSVLELPIAIPGPATAVPALPAASPIAPVVPAAPAVATTPLARAPVPDTASEEQTATEDSEPGGEWSWEWPSTSRPALLTAAGFVVIGGTAVFIQRRLRGGLLRARGSAASREGPGDAGRVTLATRALARALADYGFADSQPLLVRESRGRLEFTVHCPLGDAAALVACRHDLARRLACEIEAEVIGATRIALTLSGFQRLAGLLGEDGEGAPPALVVPVGADEGGIVYLNLAAAGSVAIMGSESERRQLLRSWLATLGTTHAPQQLALRVDAQMAEVLGEHAVIPHTGGASPPDAASMTSELSELVERWSARIGDRPVLALTSAAAGRELIPAGVLHDGPPARVFVIAAMSGDDAMARSGEFGASIAFGDTDADEDVDGGNAAEPGAIALTVGRDRPFFLDPVLVRRDTSARWSENGGVGIASPFALSPDHAQASDIDALGTIAPYAGGGDPAADAVEPDVSALPDGDAEPDGFDDEVDLDRGERGASQAALLDSEADGEVASEAPLTLPAGPGLSAPVARQGALFTLSSPNERPEAKGAVFSVRCLGGFEVRALGGPIERWPLEKSRELLAFLVAQRGASVAREVVAEALWPDYAWDAALKHTLSNVVTTLRSTLRTALDDDALQPLFAARQRFQLPTALFESDLDELEAAIRRAPSLPDAAALAEYERAFALYAGDFLEGEFFAWLDSHRLEYRQLLIDAARRAAAIATRIGELARAVAFHQAIFDREPTEEESARSLMRCFASSGDLSAVRKTYRALAEALQRELDDPRAGPSAETRTLLADLLAPTQTG